MAFPIDRQYAFCGYRLDAAARELLGPGGAVIALTSKPFDVLLQLIEHRGRVLGKDELLAAVWSGRVVEENNLTQAISALRKALGAGAGDHRYIVTVAGHGYRFVATLDEPEIAQAEPLAAAPRPAADLSAPAPLTRLRWRGWWGALATVVLLAGALTATAAWRGRAQSAVVAEAPAIPPTLAVLPFRPLGSAGENPVGDDHLLALGMAETLIARLSRSTSMRVLSLGSVQGFTGATVDPLRAGRTLGADFVVEGSTQQRGELIRINARLLSLPDGRTVWAGTFDQTPDRVFTLQDVLAEGVTAALSLRYVVTARHSSPCDGDDAEAYRASLMGRYLLGRASASRLSEAHAALSRAIALDPACARAHAGLASLYVQQALSADADPRVVLPRARAAVAQALAIDPSCAEAFVAKGSLQAWSDWSWPLAAASFRRALALDPTSADAHLAYSTALNSLGRQEEATEHVRRASKLDPLSPTVNLTQAAYLVHTDPEAAHARLASVLELEPDYWAALVRRSQWATEHGRPREAIADLRRAVDRSGRNAVVIAQLAKAHVTVGEHGRARALLHELEVRRRDGYVPATTLAMIHAALGDNDRALDELERGYAERDVRMAFFAASASLASLRGHPRFRALTQRMDLQRAPAGGAVAAN